MNCHFRPIALSLLLIAAFASSTFGQKKTAEKAKGTRLTPPPTSVVPFNTPEVALAKMDETGKMLRMIVPRLKVVPMTQTVTVTKQRRETRTREVVNADGKKVTQAYTVNVPYTEMHTLSVSALDATSKDRIKMPIEHVMAWELNGTRLEVDELRKRADKPMHFLVARQGSFPGLPAYFREAFNPNIVVIFVGKDFNKSYPDAEQFEKPSSTK